MQQKIKDRLKIPGDFRMPVWPEKYAPPGWASDEEIVIYALLFVIYILWFWLMLIVRVSSMVIRYTDQLQYLPMMRVLGNTLMFLPVMVLCAVGYIKAHYGYFTKGPKGIYTMKRVPDAFELHRRCLALPFAFLLVTAIVTGINTALAMKIYNANIPEGAVLAYELEFSFRRMIICLK